MFRFRKAFFPLLQSYSLAGPLRNEFLSSQLSFKSYHSIWRPKKSKYQEGEEVLEAVKNEENTQKNTDVDPKQQKQSNKSQEVNMNDIKQMETDQIKKEHEANAQPKEKKVYGFMQKRGKRADQNNPSQQNAPDSDPNSANSGMQFQPNFPTSSHTDINQTSQDRLDDISSDKSLIRREQRRANHAFFEIGVLLFGQFREIRNLNKQIKDLNNSLQTNSPQQKKDFLSQYSSELLNFTAQYKKNIIQLNNEQIEDCYNELIQQKQLRIQSIWKNVSGALTAFVALGGYLYYQSNKLDELKKEEKRLEEQQEQQNSNNLMFKL